MRRSLSLVLGLTAGAALFAACRDAAVAPHDALTPIALNVPPVSLNALQSDPAGASFTVTIDPRRENVYSDGINTVRFPAGSICDPATSSYGPGTWDLPCPTATSPISLPIALTVRSGRLHIEFGRALRFAPSNDPARWVVLTVDNPAVQYTAEDLRRYAVFFVTAEGTFVDEGADDPSLVTAIERGNGKVIRRLKHFSGYNLALGIWDDCTPGVDPYCFATAPTGTVAAR